MIRSCGRGDAISIRACKLNAPLGVKGVGESGCTASIPVLVSAVLDAVRPLGVKHLDMPLTLARVWPAINQA